MKKSMLLLLVATMAVTGGCKKSTKHDRFTRECTYDGQTVEMAKMSAFQSEDDNWLFITEAVFSDLDVKLHFPMSSGRETFNMAFCDLYDKDGNSLNDEISGTNHVITHYYWNDVVSIQFEIELKNGKQVVGDYFDKYTITK